MEKQNPFVRFMLLFGIMLIVTQLSMRWLGFGPEVPPVEPQEEQDIEEVVSEGSLLVGDADEQVITIGSYDPEKKEKFLAYFNSQGASLDRVELVERNDSNELQYAVIEFRHGYLGYLAPLESEDSAEGLEVRVVGDGTPAQLAGIQVGDRLTHFDGKLIGTIEELEDELRLTESGQQVELKVQRQGEELVLTAKLEDKPLTVIDPDPYPHFFDGVGENDELANSLLTELIAVNDQAIRNRNAIKLPALARSNWTLKSSDERSVTFAITLENGVYETGDSEQPQEETVRPFLGAIEITKTFTLADVAGDHAYHLDLDLGFSNHSDQIQRLAVRQHGPNSIVNETWWTSTGKTPDVKWSLNDEEDESRAASIRDQAEENPENPTKSMWRIGDKEPTLDYVITDSQFFAAGFVGFDGNAGIGLPVHDFHTELGQLIDGGGIDGGEAPANSILIPNTSFFVESKEIEIGAQQSVEQKLRVFVGPKGDELLASYGMNNVIEYGWSRAIARTLSAVMHGFQSLVGNYGVAIIMLTILVRGCMHPLTRKQVRGTQMMGFLKPQMEKINEKFKDDPRQKTMKTQELFAKYGYNPLSGCFPVLIQMPIFFGLYRSIMVDVELRGEALIPGLDWCTNLAGPDMLFYFGESSAMFINRGGMFGPYFNLLPLVTGVLFLLQITLFTPPATDDNQKMVHRMLKLMPIGMMFLFYRVASGLCIYFIASSTWGILERKMLPKIKDPDAYLEQLAEARRSKKRKPGFMQRMMAMAEETQRGQAKAANSDSERRKQLDSLRGGRRRR